MERLSKWDRLFFISLAISVGIYLVGFVILRYDQTWAHSELPADFVPHVLENGNAFVIEDSKRVFDYKAFCGAPRSRALSTLFFVLNTRFRLWLFQYLPPHPSLSFTWVFSLILSPVLLYLLMKRLSESAEVACLATLLYLMSTGLLSGLTFLFHPAKPLTNFLAILTLFLGARFFTRREKKAGGAWLSYAGMCLSLCFCFITDETAWFVYLLPAIFFAENFVRNQSRIVLCCLYVLPLLFFFAWATFLLPQMASHFGYPGFYIWSYVSQEPPPLRPFHLEIAYKNAANLLMSHLYRFDSSTTTTLLFLVVLGCVVKRYHSVHWPHRRLFLKGVLSFLLFAIYTTILMQKHRGVVQSAYYYASLSSVLFSITASLVLASRPTSKWFSKVVLLLLLSAMGLGFTNTNRDWRVRETGNYLKYLPKETREMRGKEPLTFLKVRELWNHRFDEHFLSQQKKRFEAIDYWIFYELGLVTK